MQLGLSPQSLLSRLCHCRVELLRRRRIGDLDPSGDDRLLAAGGVDLAALIGMSSSVNLSSQQEPAQYPPVSHDPTPYDRQNA